MYTVKAIDHVIVQQQQQQQRTQLTENKSARRINKRIS